MNLTKNPPKIRKSTQPETEGRVTTNPAEVKTRTPLPPPKVPAPAPAATETKPK